MFAIVLYEPEIAPNTGNVLRLASNCGARLHLVRPLGFSLSDRQLARAGLDYGAPGDITVHADWPACREHFAGGRMFAVTTRGTCRYDSLAYRSGDVFVFGPETRGLPQTVLDEFAAEDRLRIPMREGNRSMNLANAVAVVVYEAWRQQGFADGESVTSD